MSRSRETIRLNILFHDTSAPSRSNMSATTLTPTRKGSVVGETTKSPSPAQQTYGCSMSWRPCDRIVRLTTFPEHIKNLLEGAREKATDGYTRLIQSLHNDSNISGNIHKHSNGASTTSKTTYLCLQCPTVSATAEKHKKEHAFGEYNRRNSWRAHERRTDCPA